MYDKRPQTNLKRMELDRTQKKCLSVAVVTLLTNVILYIIAFKNMGHNTFTASFILFFTFPMTFILNIVSIAVYCIKSKKIGLYLTIISVLLGLLQTLWYLDSVGYY